MVDTKKCSVCGDKPISMMANNMIKFTIEGPSIPAIAYDSLARVAADAWGCSADQIELDIDASEVSHCLRSRLPRAKRYKTVAVMKRRAMSHTHLPVNFGCVYMPIMKPLSTRQGGV